MRIQWVNGKLYGVAFAALIAAGILVPTNASADEGVLLRDAQATNGDTVLHLEKGERVNWTETKDGNYLVERDYMMYELDKYTVLHTQADDEVTYGLKEGVVLYIEPKLSSIAIGEVREELSYSADEILDEEPGWYQVQLPEGLTGWVSAEDVGQTRNGSQVTTKAYSNEDGPVFEYGEEIQLSDFDGKEYTVLKPDGSTAKLAEKNVSFTKPEPRIVYTPPVQSQPVQAAAQRPASGGTATSPESQSSMSGNSEQSSVDPSVSKSQQASTPMDSGVSSGDRFGDLIEYAKMELGKPYVWGGNGEVGFDCSGFTTEMFKKIGISLPRTAATQAQLGTTVTDLQVGDLLFYSTYKAGPSHVSIYMGNGQMIHAAGQKVHIANVSWPYWQERFLYAKRIR